MTKGFAEHWLADKTKREARSRARRTFWTAASAVGSVVASGPVIWGAVFSGEVEALNTPTIRRLTPSRHHQLPRICRTPARGALDEPQRGSIRGSAVSITGFDDACLVAKLVGEPVADEHFDVRRHSLGVRSPLRRQRHLLRLRESLWVLVIHLISPLRPQSRVSGYNGCQRYYRAGNPERIGGTRPGPKGRVRVRNTNASPHAT